jgi:hypothetical protein
MSVFRPEVELFLERFFSPPNRLRRDSDPRLTPWIDRLQGESPAATVLPCWRGGQAVDWYGLAFDDRQLRALGEDLTAFVGPSYTTFRGQQAVLDRADPVEAAVANLTGGRAFKFWGGAGKKPAEPVWAALKRMRGVWQRQPQRGAAEPPAAGRLLHDFFADLQAGNGAGAEEVLAEMESWQLLDAVNLLFLRVQLDATQGRWDRLLAAQQLPELLRMRRPMPVTEALAEAVYQTHLRAPEEAGDLAGMVTAFRASVLPLYGALYAVRGASRSGALLRGLMLRAVSADPPLRDLMADLLTAEGLDPADRAALQSLAALAVPAVAPTPAPAAESLEEAAGLLRRGEYDRALEVLRAFPATLERARLACECAFELGTLDARAVAVAAVEGLSDSERRLFLAGRMNRQLWEALGPGRAGAGAVKAAVPRGWHDWLDLLAEHDGQRRGRALAAQGAAEWPVSPLAERPDEVEHLARRLVSLPRAEEEVVYDSLPHLLAFFRKDPGWPRRAFRPVYRAILDLLWASTRGGEADLSLFNDLADALLRLGLDSGEYGQLLEQAMDLWQRFRAPALFDWLLNFLAVLSEQPCPDAERRRTLLDGAVNGYLQLAPRVTAEQRALLLELAGLQGEAGRVEGLLPSPSVPSGREDSMGGLREMSVAIYSLTDSAARLAGEVLERGYPGVKVRLSHDKDCSRRLQQLARQADLFVMVTASAKHAATSCIEEHRPHDLPLLRPDGKGAASILRAVRQHFRAR